ncbi:hypothetical protein WR25_11510 [Diploscapter pachys]|uniref:Small ribosomal subunit protein mS25 n=1 Tax=Diploscapter pachys TaxID=2018661 RepID=A0A2A2JJZ9_9BILA|nr:hypothetical protein WR25_11510 [Diploscapter pachys]
MPFMHGSMPLRRTYYYLNQGKIKFRDNVQVFAMGFHRRPEARQVGAREFVYWHWAQLQYHNPKVQLVKHTDVVITPFAKAYLNDGREVLFDLEGMSKDQISQVLIDTLGKTDLVMKREKLEKIAKLNPADFGAHCERQCICLVQGQHPCTALLPAPKYMTGKWSGLSANDLFIVAALVVLVDVEVAQLVGVLVDGHHAQPVTQSVLLQVSIFWLDIPLGEGDLGDDRDLGLGDLDLDVVGSELTGLAVDLDARVEEVLLQGVGLIRDRNTLCPVSAETGTVALSRA